MDLSLVQGRPKMKYMQTKCHASVKIVNRGMCLCTDRDVLTIGISHMIVQILNLLVHTGSEKVKSDSQQVFSWP